MTVSAKTRASKASEPAEGASCRLPAQDAETSARARRARLNFTADCMPGIRRVRNDGGTFEYRNPDGSTVDAPTRQRIEDLKIPPAWRDVWICDDERGHVQATGRDARGRKQYRYHDDWKILRDASKYERMVDFGEALSAIRAQVDRDLRRPTLDRSRVVALLVSVLDRSLVRIGNPQYARDNESFGLTTLRAEHVDVGTVRVQLRFRGKAGKQFEASISDPRIARAMRRLRELPGQELFQYVDESGTTRLLGSADVNDYLREAGGSEITSKDFRTWGGSLVAANALRQWSGPPSEAAVAHAVKDAAATLGNTPAVCRRAYIHPGLIDLYMDGRLDAAWLSAERDEPSSPYLADNERAFLGVLRRLG